MPAFALLYSVSRPNADGTPTALENMITKVSNYGSEWERRNSLHTVAVEQAAHDRNLFNNSGRNQHVDLKFPE